jgi:hypothetical protein
MEGDLSPLNSMRLASSLYTPPPTHFSLLPIEKLWQAAPEEVNLVWCMATIHENFDSHFLQIHPPLGTDYHSKVF